jgi:transcriptional regulator with XRE-family HTH domain
VRMSKTKLETDLMPSFNIGDRLRKAREVTGLGRSEFASELGMSDRTVSRYENGEFPPKKLLLLWKMRTGVSLAWVLTGSRDISERSVDDLIRESRLRESNSRPSHYKAYGVA